MKRTIDAVFDGTVLQPQESLDLAPDVTVRITIEEVLPASAGDMKARRQRAIAVAGRFASGLSDVSTRHDTYLTEAIGS